jgi:hypothetical protein
MEDTKIPGFVQGGPKNVPTKTLASNLLLFAICGESDKAQHRSIRINDYIEIGNVTAGHMSTYFSLLTSNLRPLDHPVKSVNNILHFEKP